MTDSFFLIVLVFKPPSSLVLVCWKFPLFLSLSAVRFTKIDYLYGDITQRKTMRKRDKKKVCQTETEAGKSYFAFYVSVKASFVRFIFIFLSSEPSMKIIKKENHFYLSVVVQACITLNCTTRRAIFFEYTFFR